MVDTAPAGFWTSPAEGGGRARLLWLTIARLVLAGVCVAAALGADLLGAGLSGGVQAGFYWTAGLGAVLALLGAIGQGRIGSSDRFSMVQLAADVAIVTSLIHFSGGRDSLFSFLYALVPVYGAVLAGGRGALTAATLSALAYAGILLANNVGWIGTPESIVESVSIPVLAAIWGVHVGALFLVGALASVLSGDLNRTGAALDQSKTDLRRLRDLHQRTVESVMSGLLTTDSDEKVTSFNPEAERIIAARASEVIGSELEAVIPGVRKLVRRASEWEVPAGSRRARLRIENRRGEQLHLGVASSVLRDAGGNPAGHVVIFQDVTSVVAMEEDLRRSERMAAIGEMGAKIAHEIRNPLAAISGSIEILGKSGTRSLSGSEPARLMDIVVRETDRLNRLITNFLNYARPTPLKLSRVCLETLVAEVLEMFEAVRPRSVEVVATELKPVSVAADAEQLRQVVWNLCLNGVQAMGEGGRLVLRTGLLASDSPQALSLSGRNETTEVASLGTGGAGVWAEISVSDTGMGISPEVRDRMFEPFFTTKREGTGLGLATVHRVVESHGGVLQLESEEGKGTVVRVLLPCVESSA